MSIKKERIKVYEMTCGSCEARVEREVKKLKGVVNAKASYSGQHLDVEYDIEFCKSEHIKNAVTAAGYSTRNSGDSKIFGIIIIALAIIILGKSTQGFDMNEKLTNASYFVLFIVGVLTSIHCVGMCGGIMLSQSVNISDDGLQSKFDAMKPALLYNLGRVISYTLLGGLVGALGSAISLSLGMQAGLQIFAAVFMVIMGLNMAGFGIFRKLHIKLPWSPCAIRRKSNAPLIVGLLNGFMPCGPLQTMQLYALSTGSPVKGAVSMFIFTLGTVPLMLAFGAISGLLSKGYTKKLLKFSGILVIVLGIIMGRRGLALAGINFPSVSMPSGNAQKQIDGVKAKLENGVQIINLTADGRGYTPSVLYVQKNMPVKLVIDGKQITGCNNEIVIPSMNKRLKLKSGENILEFTAKESDINFSCWMGMIRGVIKVVDNLDSPNVTPVDSSDAAPGGGAGCCAVDSAPSTPSIYGDDLANVPAERLVKKALVSGDVQNFNIKGIGYEFDPLIIVVNKDVKMKLAFDLESFEDPAGKFTILNGETNQAVTTFNGSNSTVNFEYTFNKAGGYGIIKNNTIYGVIEVVEDIKTADIEKIKSNYLQ